MPPIASPPSHGPDPCQDRVPNCADYDTSVCTNHELWANTNCARTCNICAPGTSTVETPCVDKELDCAYYSVTMCDTYRPWAMKNCRESCGYCGPGRQTSGFFGTCFYKGARYRQGDKWDDGCAYECECTDGNTGRYVCYNKCPSYYNFPDECKLVQKRNKCCLEPVCNFEVQYTTKNVSEWCVFDSRNYMQGEIWSVGCEFDCICVDPARQFYTCQSKCAQYGLLPSICKMVTPPGEYENKSYSEADFNYVRFNLALSLPPSLCLSVSVSLSIHLSIYLSLYLSLIKYVCIYFEDFLTARFFQLYLTIHLSIRPYPFLQPYFHLFNSLLIPLCSYLLFAFVHLPVNKNIIALAVLQPFCN